jgi:hypothetical protein
MLVILGALLVATSVSCGSGETTNPPMENPKDLPSIAGVSLDQTSEEVEEILGNEYEETYVDVEGHFGETYYLRKYGGGLTLILGKDTDKVLEIELVSKEHQTWQGDKIGDAAEDVLSKYREEYPEVQSFHEDKTLEGWFDLGDGVIIIFDFDKDDGMLINADISEDSEVELIKLTKIQYMY